MASPTWETAKRVLCIRLDSLGDVLMTTPALHAIKNAVPGRRLTLLTSPEGSALEGLLPDVDEFISYRSPWMKATPVRQDSSIDRAMIDRLRADNFDAAAIFSVFSQNPLSAALPCYLAEIPLRVAHCRENPYQLLSDWVREEEPEKRICHEVERQLNLAATVNCRTEDDRLKLCVPRKAKLEIESLLAQSGLDERRPWLVLHAGASAPSRRYPAEMYAEAAAELTEKHGFQLVLTGIEAERGLAAEIQSRLARSAISLVGHLDVPHLAALIERAPLLLSNNTGPVHLAAALGTPVVVLYALTNPQHTPWRTPSRVLFYDVPCKNCFKSLCPLEHHRCLRGIPPKAVVAAVVELFAETRRTRCLPSESTQFFTIPQHVS